MKKNIDYSYDYITGPVNPISSDTQKEYRIPRLTTTSVDLSLLYMPK